ncbi:MAG TPA: hypothetical protein VII06_02960 [Chloroflexota bacterium]|jgi:hypothetical protein
MAAATAPTANVGAAVGTPVGSGPADAAANLPAAVRTAVAVKTNAVPKPAPEQLDPRVLAADPAPQVGKPVVVVGQIARVIERGSQRWAELLAQPPGETEIQSVDLLLDADVAPIARDECYRVVGVAAGRDEPGRAFTGGARDVPLVLGTEAEPAPLGPYGIGCAPP